MKAVCRFSCVAALVFLILVPAVASAKDFFVKQPPASLDKLYPPLSKEPKWIQQMHKMSGSFGGVFVNMKEGDWENAEKLAGQFVEAYKETSKMVPEWEEYFDLDAARKFAETVKTRDGTEIGKEAGPVGKTCGKCHGDNEVSVWAKYHWPSFHEVKVIDPHDDKEVEFDEYMKSISGAFKGVTVNFKEGQNDRAGKAARVFKAKYTELKSTCSKCHTNGDVKRFYVGESVSAALSGLVDELRKEKPDPGKVWQNVGIIGREGCKHCHLVHRSASFIKERWEEK